MNPRRHHRPRFDSLESKVVPSAGVGAMPVGHAPVRAREIVLTGAANGDYTSPPAIPDTGTRYHLTATGTITPLGPAVVSGSFHTPGFIRNGRPSGSLRVAGASGTLTLRLSARHLIVGPPATAGPSIRASFFDYAIVKGTGRYAHARGSGPVDITTTPGLTGLTGPGIFNTATTLAAGTGRTTITFGVGTPPPADLAWVSTR